MTRGFCQVKKIQKSEKNSEVVGWVNPQLGFFDFFGKFVLFCDFLVVLFVVHVSKKMKNWIGG